MTPEDNTVRIPLTQGEYAIIDAADLPLVQEYNWRLHVTKRQRYARGRSRVPGKRGKPSVYLHRLLLQPAPHVRVDHKNHNGLDCRRSNLRECTGSTNGGNKRSQVGSRAPYKGIWKKDNKWLAEVRCQGKRHYLGRYLNPEDAARAYDSKAREVFGEYAHTNFPD